MADEAIPIMGGKSVFCINESQLEEALRLSNEDPESSGIIQKKLLEIESSMTRNERAALAFILIKRLQDKPEL